MYQSLRRPLVLSGHFILIGTMVAFFGFHTFAGERGLMARAGLDRDIMLARERLALVEKQNYMLEQRISLLQTGAVDADMLAETARSDVGLYADNDVIITIPLEFLKF